MAALATQSTLTNMASKFGGKTPVRVYFLDNSSKMFLLEPSTTVAQFIAIILSKLMVADGESVSTYFGIFASLDGNSIGEVRKMNEVVLNILEEWGRSASLVNAKFVFMIRLFMPSIWGLEFMDEVNRRAERSLTLNEYLKLAKVRDPNLIQLQYLQAVYGVITGQYPTSVEQAIKLGMLHFTHKFGQYYPTSHKVGFLGSRIVEFIPVKILKQKSLDKWEEALLRAVADHHTSYEAATASSGGETEAENIQKQYLDEIFPMITFGCTLFRCKVNARASASALARSIPLDCVLGIHQMGIHVFEKGSSRTLSNSYRIEEIFRWGFRSDEMFYFEVQSTPETSGVVEFDTSEGSKISELLTDYAMAFVKEKENEEERQRLALGGGLPEASPKAKTKKVSKGGKTSKGSKDKDRDSSSSSSATAAAAAPVVVEEPLPMPPPELSHQLSAMQIQAVFRGYRDRIRVSEMIEAMLEAGDL